MKDDLAVMAVLAAAFAVLGLAAFAAYALYTEGIPWLIEFLKINGVRFP